MLKSLNKTRLIQSIKAALRRARPRQPLRIDHAQEAATIPDSTCAPPKALQDCVGGSYQEVGQEFLQYFIELGHLKPDERVLDIGCGSGRMAVPLASYLSNAAQYRGFDVSHAAISWCRDNITPRFPSFRFEFADLLNAPYNPTGQKRPSQYRFPYDDEMFDFVFATSVFTHMLPADMDHYLAEISRVLQPAGRALITFFLLNDNSTALINARRGTYNFEHTGPGYRTTNPSQPEEAIAYPETFIRNLYERHGLKIREPISYGSWCGREDYLSFQDIIVAAKA